MKQPAGLLAHDKGSIHCNHHFNINIFTVFGQSILLQTHTGGVSLQGHPLASLGSATCSANSILIPNPRSQAGLEAHLLSVFASERNPSHSTGIFPIKPTASQYAYLPLRRTLRPSLGPPIEPHSFPILKSLLPSNSLGQGSHPGSLEGRWEVPFSLEIGWSRSTICFLK